jgi:para-aminobenzoate synthetase / 4-amino-4-deoxychorismate lyase
VPDLRLIRRRIASSLSPCAALLKARHELRPVALLGAWAGGGALVASGPIGCARPGEDPFAVLERMPEVDGEAEGVGGGWFGFLGYPLGARVERLPPAPHQPIAVGPSSLAYYDHLLRLDSEGQWWFEALWSDAAAPRLERRLSVLRERMAAPPDESVVYRCGAFAGTPSATGHRAAVEQCLRHISAGDLYQANITMRLEAEFEGEAIDLFAACAERLRPAYGAYVGDPGHQAVSLSPELFLARRGRAVCTAPIKGTVARTGDSADENARLGEITRSAKDRAENVMIVDLMRNDFGRVCTYGSISVPAVARAEAHPGVWHLVSDVRGTLLPNVTDGELLRATFPPGSVTGAPKIKAMEVIAELESTARAIYTGAIGFASPCWGLELNVAIRTFEVAAGRVWLGVGGGVVADSTPAGEYRESLVKAGPLLAAAGAELAPDDGPRPSKRVPPATRRPRPDVAYGIFETILVTGRHAHGAHAHCQRLAQSAWTLYGYAIDVDVLVNAVERAARNAVHGRPHRLRVALLPEREPEVALTPIEWGAVLPASAAVLEPLALPGGLGAHKWTDRRLLDVAAASGVEPLIVELDGEVLETARGNIVAVERGALISPPCDGRILPGVTRAVALDLARAAGFQVREERLGLDRVRAADEIMVTSAIRLVQPAIAAAGQAPGPIARRLATLVERQFLPLVDRPALPHR